ncbi:MAG: hypothetical protein KGI56_06040, partial [Acidobacteriota bacterium]|nr:hypothetical protein [Acidobacteriota bacterium]
VLPERDRQAQAQRAPRLRSSPRPNGAAAPAGDTSLDRIKGLPAIGILFFPEQTDRLEGLEQA